MEVTRSGKHSSLLVHGSNFWTKKFYSPGSWNLFYSGRFWPYVFLEEKEQVWLQIWIFREKHHTRAGFCWDLMNEPKGEKPLAVHRTYTFGHSMNELPLTRFDEMLLQWNAPSMKCHINEMPLQWNATTMKCHFNEMPLQWNATSMKCHFNEMPLQWNAASMKSRLTSLTLRRGNWID